MSQAGDTAVKPGSTLYLVLLSYAALYIVWGSTYLFIKLAVQTIPPLYVVGGRFLLGGMFFIIFSLVTGRVKRLPAKREIGSALLLGALLLLGGNGLVSFAVQKVDSYLAALIVSTTPVVVGLFDWLLFRKRMSLFRGAGVALGVIGVMILLYDGGTKSIELTPHILMVVAGLASWALATSLGHRMPVYPDAFVNSGLQMLFVGVISMVVLLFTNPPTTVMVQQVTLVSAAGVLYLSIFGSLAFCAYSYLIQHEPAIRVTTYAFVNPVIAIFLGIAVVGEVMKPFLVPGTIVILAGLFFMLYGDALFGKKRSA